MPVLTQRFGRLRKATLPAVTCLVVMGLILSPFFRDPLVPLATTAAIAAALVLCAVSLSRRDAVAVLTVMLVLLFLIPQPYVVVGPLRSVGNPAQMVGTLALALWASGRVLGLLRARRAHPARWAVLAFALASATAFAAGMTRVLDPGESAGAVRAIFPLLAAAGIFLLAVDALPTQEMVERILYRLVLLGGVSALIGISEFMAGFSYRQSMLLPGLTVNDEGDQGARAGFVRVVAAASHPIEYAVILAALTPLALHMAMHGRTRAIRRNSRVALFLMLVVNPMTVSRSGLLALAVGLAIYFVHLTPRGRLNALVLAVIGLGLFRAAVPGLLGTLKYFIFAGSQDNSITGRTDDYTRIPGLMDGHLFFGRGLGTFQPAEYFYLDNLYLLTYLEGGLFCLGALAALFVTGMCLARGFRKRSVGRADRGLGQALAAGMGAIAAAGLAFDEFSFRQTAFTFYLLLGCTAALWTIAKDRESLAAQVDDATQGNWVWPDTPLVARSRG